MTYTPTPEEQEAFDRRLAEASAREEAVPPPRKIKGSEVVWVAQDGSQSDFLSCQVFETLFHGTRGPGKTDSLIMSFTQHVDKGYGAAWRGIIFRQSYPQLADVQAKTEKWFKRIYGGRAKFNRSKMMWEWDTGEVLLLRHMARPEDYWNYHGHEYPFIGWEELTNWPSDQCFKAMFACCRSSTTGVPRMIRATTNPYGVGHNWVKDRYNLGGQWWKNISQLHPVDSEGRAEPPRCAIYGHIGENKILLAADPDYPRTVVASAANPAMAEAWLRGSWDIVAGGMFDDVYNPKVHLVKPFKVPHSWRIDRAFDWGSSAPFSVGWWAESDGSDYVDANGKWRSSVKGDLYRIGEWYGWNGKPNEGQRLLAVDIAKGIIERELLWGLRNGQSTRVKAGPADTSIFDVENGMCIANDMAKRVRLDDGREFPGPQFTRADKSPGSRKTGWEQIRKMLKQATRAEGAPPRETPGLFIFDTCEQWKRCVPSLPRSEKDPDDVDTNAEDHNGDETRYRVRSSGTRVTGGRVRGLV